MSAAFTISPDRYCVHQVTLMEQCNFRQSVECLSHHGVYKTAVWHPKLLEVGATAGQQILSDNGVQPVALCAAVLLGNGDTKTIRQCVDENRKMLDCAKAIGAPSVIVITGGLERFGRNLADARAQAMEVLAALAPYAQEMGLKLVLEPLHPMVCGNRSVISTLQEANQFLDAIDLDDVLGIALDTYAVWWQGDLEQQIKNTGKRICHFHVSDWLPQTTDLRLDRGMPGDGLIDNQQIRQWLELTGFEGAVEVEIFSKGNWWQKDKNVVLSTILQRYNDYL